MTDSTPAKTSGIDHGRATNACTLRDWQAAFAQALKANDAAPCFERLTVKAVEPSPAQGLGVYRNNTSGCRRRALEDVYPVCRKVLGNDCFQALCHSYVTQHASRQSDLNHEGRRFPELLASRVSKDAAFARLPWLEDLARLEWHCHQCYYLADDYEPEPVDPGTDPANLHPLLSPSLRWLKTDWPVLRVWAAHQDKQEPTGLFMEAAPGAYVIQRLSDFTSTPVEVSANFIDVLDACHSGLSIGDIVDLETGRNDGQSVVEILSELRLNGWLLGLGQADV